MGNLGYKADIGNYRHFQWGVKMEEEKGYFTLKLWPLSLMSFAKD